MAKGQSSQKNLTTYEKQKLEKKLLHTEGEKLDAMGQESEKKAKKWIIENAKEDEKKEKKKQEDQLERLDFYRKKRTEYQRFLLFMLHDMIKEVGLPKSYQWGVWFDGKGIRVRVIDKVGKSFQRAFYISYSPIHDTEICYQFAIWVEDIYDLAEKHLLIPQKKSIWSPKKKQMN